MIPGTTISKITTRERTEGVHQLHSTYLHNMTLAIYKQNLGDHSLLFILAKLDTNKTETISSSTIYHTDTF